ncbi:hypothetical protein ACE5IS_16135 [Leptospira wolffii]|uniref:Uncharacterized protein n=1 Tax=Leptospira wolffii TaxID=409998 RepID=A0A2M9Z916_9LEPT|nr:hypothetical protein [Leptospira wolffii]EPG66157.1 hypothetical protein LEP1GSC061_3971 [Leptospira wolffii serovar Khorat str. Khorat-H2]PJZ64905.1 hypothetical protein CH371_15485 [Leptospira wolffii]TGK58182.1 hypothetical protein EHQ32_12865 [Leptospira wolffii]TGK67400.1 hypothetical protein EHQ27_15725 [Leptospira wolffii]TGK68860.1 hypothetical protein EHQ35_18735 [Leptospira wolffii]
MTYLIEKYVALKNKYRNYDTKEALRRMQACRIALKELEDKGFRTGVEILGSINFGIVEPSSDIDCILLHFCDLHKDQECPEYCPNFLYEAEEIKTNLRRRLKNENLKIEFLDCINLRMVERALESDNWKEHEVLRRLLFYRTIGRPVNRPLFIPYTERLEENEDYIKDILEWGSEALSVYLGTSRHRFSFNKYNERIESSGLQLPPGLKEELESYLDQGEGESPSSPISAHYGD